MREASLQDKAIKFPHLLLINPLTSGNWSAQNLKIMGKYLNYETPQVEVIEVEVEKGFATSPGGDGYGGTETPGTGA